jgi:cytochrome c oxidase assembly factor CtaG
LAILVALTIGLVFWIVAWSFGIKAFDAIMVTALMVVTAAAVRAVAPFVKQLLGREAAPGSERGAGF